MNNYEEGDLGDIVRASTNNNNNSRSSRLDAGVLPYEFKDDNLYSIADDHDNNMDNFLLDHHDQYMIPSSSSGLQISSAPPPAASPPAGVMNEAAAYGNGMMTTTSSNEMRKMNVNYECSSSSSNNNGKDRLLLDKPTAVQAHQIPPLLPKFGVKRRKSQAKKVVCIPAPTVAAMNKQSGEVVPSDLWAWRKYGQKPIKGSPFPRGYYRCSSSKGCSARKQVERSRANPNMLVITYTSEHNHPWPTQRNALAGSTRSQPLKNNVVDSSKPLEVAQMTIVANNVHVKEESINKEASVENDSSTIKSLKKEDENKVVEDFGCHDQDQLTSNSNGDVGSHLNQSYRPIMDVSNSKQPDEEFFADLEFDDVHGPLNILFTQGSNTIDPLSSLFHWAPNNSTIGLKNDEHNDSQHS